MHSTWPTLGHSDRRRCRWDRKRTEVRIVVEQVAILVMAAGLGRAGVAQIAAATVEPAAVAVARAKGIVAGGVSAEGQVAAVRLRTDSGPRAAVYMAVHNQPAAAAHRRLGPHTAGAEEDFDKPCQGHEGTET